ncbi:MAG: ATP-binding protein [Methylocystis sp.]|uniref:sensor histidine kinase n=1 Tax=Methylocystis sp. TaxID=1911079 RepID=UPI003D0F54CD
MSLRGSKVRVSRKWRPSVGLIVALVMLAALALPLAGLFFFRIYENQLVHQTESELIGQSAVLAAVMRRDMEATLPVGVSLGVEAPQSPADADPYRPITPTLDLTRDDMLGRRPEAAPASAPADPAFVALGVRLAPDLIETQKTTLAGFRLLDPKGVVIAGGEDVGLSLAHVEEVAEALRGRFRSVMRLRISKHDPPPLYSWSRGTAVRVFTAMPVTLHGRVAGVVYASRTPSNVFKNFYEERGKVAAAGATIFVLALLIGSIFQRAITLPMRELMSRTAAIARGDRAALTPVTHHGTAEFAQLTQSFFDMAEALQSRSDFIATFAAHVSHELKSPLTAIQGAAELLREDVGTPAGGMSDAERRRFLTNIIADTGRLTAIVQRLRELARAEATPIAGETTLEKGLAELRSAFSALRIEAEGPLSASVGMSLENVSVALSHLADNAQRHGATKLTISCARKGDDLMIVVRDDGRGVSRANRDRIFDSFFTTQREEGGTGMGLAIVRAMLQAHGGSIDFIEEGDDETSRGAAFAIAIPLAHR